MCLWADKSRSVILYTVLSHADTVWSDYWRGTNFYKHLKACVVFKKRILHVNGVLFLFVTLVIFKCSFQQVWAQQQYLNLGRTLSTVSCWMSTLTCFLISACCMVVSLSLCGLWTCWGTCLAAVGLLQGLQIILFIPTYLCTVTRRKLAGVSAH